ncbi:hypothetical protein Q9R19_00030 [Microbacterium sp. ARD32]|uniref:hypothetical protein n=1 Tax=Microbacterium sp. ARD32 TaxID=2962577 RepID=UPI0028818DDC|nr:hypothetical protein [Microbacterium sp. ARD32]MDT0156006.1 hypothetical protein [Microbacterium sp. ARD32]
MKRLTAVSALAGLLLLAACSPAPPSPDSTDAAEATPAQPSASAPAVVTAAERPDPAGSCLSIDLDAATATGAQLGTCFSDALHVLGTFRAKADMGDEQQQSEVRLRPDVAIHGVTTGGDDPNEVVFVDDVAYQNDGTGWVKGDPDSDDSEKMIVGQAGRVMVAVFSGDVLRESVQACPVWNLLPAREKTTLPDDVVVEARVFECAAPYDMFGSTITGSRLLFEQDWTPVGASSTATGFGQTVRSEQWWYDFGTDLEITAPI